MRRLGGTYANLFDELVRERVGLASSPRHQQMRARVIDAAMRRAGEDDEATYLARLRHDHQEFDALVSELTVPETYFFRDPPHYELLRREVLPAITAARGREHVIEAWSAGCATGEEPYSLAMLCDEERLLPRVRVLGTDVSRRALERAQRATYGRWSLRSTSDAQRERFFEPSGREVRVAERICRHVRFERHSLMSEPYPRPRAFGRGFDLILCRNVMIYFDAGGCARTAQWLAQSLAEHGYLMLGPSDPVLEIEEWCDTLTTPCGLLYRRRLNVVPPLRRSEPRALPVSERPVEFFIDAAAPSEPVASPPAEEPDADALPSQVRALVQEYGALRAEAACREWVRLQPLSPAAQLLHASLLLDVGRDLDAERALRRALYLDRTLLIAQMLSATLQEKRGRHAEAAKSYEQVAAQARVRSAEDAVPLGEGITHAGLAALAEQRARALKKRGTA